MPPITDNQTLKKLYNAFDGFPLHPDNQRDQAFYVDCQKVRGDTDILDDIGRHIEWSDESTCQLYAGHRGAGKSTELLRLKQHLEQQGFHVVYFAADDGDIDPEDARYTDILLACVRQLLGNLKQTDPSPLNRWFKSMGKTLKEFAQTEIGVDIQGEVAIPLQFAKLTANLRGSPSARQKIREQVEPHMVGLLDALNEFIQEACHSEIEPNKLVLIVDNLDRIVPVYDKETKRSNHESIFLDRNEQLTALQCHVIYTVPISLVYSEHGTLLKDRYENLGVLPMITVHERTPERKRYQTGLDSFYELLDKRAQFAAGCSILDVFGDKAIIDELCLMSGGHLRNLMQLLQGTLRYLPQFQDAQKAMARSIISMRETYLSAIDHEDWAQLAKVYQSFEMLNEQDYRDLLFNRSILEYWDSATQSKWHDVHPVIWDIKQFKRALIRLSESFESQTIDSAKHISNTLPTTNSTIISLSIKNLTTIKSESLKFSSSLNIIIGENSTGKSHLLKAAYSLAKASYKFGQQAEDSLLKELKDKLVNVFRAEKLSFLINHQALSNKTVEAEIEVQFSDLDLNLGLKFGESLHSDALTQIPQAYLAKTPVFFPAKEIISMYPKFGGLYRDYHIELDETYYDLCLLLERPVAKNPTPKTQHILTEIETILGGKIIDRNGRFYLKMPDKPEIEMHLLAEGLRKMATLAYLVSNDSLVGNIVFWDEPESNLNPKLMTMLVKILLLLIQNGTQVILATHSLFLLREFELQIQQKNMDIPRKFFGLSFNDENEVEINSGDVIHELEPIIALDAELFQSEAYCKLFESEDDE
ncbi:MAG: ATP-binding protein [Thiotrichaceae bacterium]|nr:ATP-binding protein [Thiotrichaceae bacterium]